MSIQRTQDPRRRWRYLALAGCLALAGGTLSSARGQDADRLPLKLTAFAVNLGTTPTLREPRNRSGIVEITIERWSTEAEHDELLAALKDHGENGLLRALQENPRVGSIRSTNSLAWDLHYARQRSLPDGSRRLFLATDRPISIWEAANQPRSIHYPFTLIEVHLGADGRGEGKLSIATKIEISPDHKEIQLENFATQPVRLEDVHVSR